MSVDTCGHGTEKVRIEVWESRWNQLGAALLRWQEMNDRINLRIANNRDASDLEGNEFELRGELAEAAERLVEEAVIVEGPS